MYFKIPFTLTFNKREYPGYLGSNDTDLPKVFFVFIDDYIVGNLLYLGYWKFEQVGTRCPRLTDGERNAIATQLGNIVELWVE